MSAPTYLEKTQFISRTLRGHDLPVLARLDATQPIGTRPRKEVGRAQRLAAEGEAGESLYEVSGARWCYPGNALGRFMLH
jgi:hypothetical protein